MNRRRKAASAASDMGSSSFTSEIESFDSPRTRHVSDNASNIFAAFVFVVVFLIVMLIGYLIMHTVDIWIICIGFIVAVIAIFTIRICSQWENVIILRFGRFARLVRPGLFFTIPFVESIALRADLRTMLTGFNAEETLTNDLVPVNIDAAMFWMVWDAQKACMEVENYYDAVSMAAQTALRDAIGRKSITDITVHRDKLDQELRDKIEEKAEPWGISVLSVEIRDIVIPKELQDDMAAAAKAERKRDARITLAEVEKDVASMLLDATEIYRQDEMAFELRSMHLLSEGVNESGSTLVIPSAYSEGFKRENNKGEKPEKAQ